MISRRVRCSASSITVDSLVVLRVEVVGSMPSKIYLVVRPLRSRFVYWVRQNSGQIPSLGQPGESTKRQTMLGVCYAGAKAHIPTILGCSWSLLTRRPSSCIQWVSELDGLRVANRMVATPYLIEDVLSPWRNVFTFAPALRSTTAVDWQRWS